ncbi:MAG: nucleotide exchange factor GrpE [Promethearchaeota archaeon]
MNETNNSAPKKSENNAASVSKDSENKVLEEDKKAQNVESVIKPDKTKKLEEKEHFELEYFSKEEFIEKLQNLEKTLEEKEDQLKKVKEEKEKSQKKYMHLQAEFENAQKRWDKNRQSLRIEYTASALKTFLPLYDSFKKALDSANDTEKKILNSFYTQFMNIFKSHGAEPIHVELNDQFDYNLHEALTSVEKGDIPENSIVEIVQDGWKYGKEVLRYAKVIISKKPKPPEPEPELEEEKIEEEEDKEPISEEATTEQVKIEEDNRKEKIVKKHKKDKEEKKSE